VWFGVLIGMNLQTSFLTPPFGFALFYLRSVAPPEVKSRDIYWGAVPFVLIQIAMIGIVLAFPQLVSAHKPAAATAAVSEIQVMPAASDNPDDAVQLLEQLSQQPHESQP
jgi:hypothetical protein